MGLTSSVSADNQTITIKIAGRFDFNLHRSFREAYKEAIERPCRILVDLAETEYMDSSALGMLLVLRDRVGGDDADISIRNASPEIRRIFSVSNMDKMFEIG